MNDKLRLVCYILAVLAFALAAVTNRRATPRAIAIELIATGLAVATLPLLVDTWVKL